MGSSALATSAAPGGWFAQGAEHRSLEGVVGMTATLTRARSEGSGPAPAVASFDPEAQVDGILARRPAVGFALGVVRDGRLESFVGRGLADVATGAPITEDTLFRIASISKTFTAIAIMQLWEQGLVDLDAPASESLRAFRLLPARPERPARDDPRPADPYGRRPRVAATVGPVPARLGRQRACRGTHPLACRLLPRRHPSRRGAGRVDSRTRITGSPRSSRSSRT